MTATRITSQTSLFIVHLELGDANALVARWHRHHEPALNHRFSIGVVDEAGDVHGAVIVGRPVARLGGDMRTVLEVTRLVTDGTPNACSALYGAAARSGKTLGYCRIQTYILDTELGTSLRASGWVDEGAAGGGSWFRENDPTHSSAVDRHPIQGKRRYAKALNPERRVNLPEGGEEDLQLEMAI